MPFLSNSPYVQVLGFKRATPWYLAGGAPTPVAAYQPKGAASLAASYTNLANPGTYDAAPGVAPAWDATDGWGFNGGSYLTTGIVWQPTWTVIVRFSSFSVNEKFLFGSRALDNSSYWFGIDPQNNAGQRVYQNGGSLYKSPGVLGGVMAIAGANAFLDGVLESGAMSTPQANYRPMYIGGLHYSDGIPNFTATFHTQAFAIYDTVLTAQQVAAVTAAMQAL